MSCSIVVSNLVKEYLLDPRSVSGAVSSIRQEGEEGLRSVKKALDGVSFTINEGERVGFIGENGAGKSTLLQILAGVSNPTSGSIEVNGHVHAILTLGLGLREDLSGRENLYLDGEVQGKKRSEVDEIIDQMIEFIDIGDFIDKPVRTYSSGMKARLTFASLIFIEPEILLIDEALGAGDHKFNAKASKVIKDLCARGKIVIVVSHALDSIVDLCSRCIWLDHGRVVRDGDPAEVIGAYREWIRKRDDEQMYEKFASQVVCRANDESCSLSLLEIGMGAANRGVVFTGEDVWIRVGWQIARHVSNPDLRMRIERMDGLLVAEQYMSETVEDGALLHSSNEIRLMMSPFLPRDGTYRLCFDLLEDGCVVATRSLVFKCIDDRQYKGGVPLLRAPMEVHAEYVSAYSGSEGFVERNVGKP